MSSPSSWNSYLFYQKEYQRLIAEVKAVNQPQHGQMRKSLKKSVVTAFNTLSAKRQQVIEKVSLITGLLNQCKSNTLYYRFAMSEIAANLCVRLSVFVIISAFQT